MNESTAFRTMQEALSSTERFSFDKMPRMKSLAERITHVRKNILDMTQEELAAALGVKRGAVGNWELGAGIATKNLRGIVKLAPGKVSLDWLAENIGPAPEAGSSAARA